MTWREICLLLGLIWQANAILISLDSAVGICQGEAWAALQVWCLQSQRWAVLT